jgi:GNAT superfamily N-acetyltransferase
MLRQFAEAPDRYTEISSDVTRFADERMCVLQGLTWAAVSDVHTDDVEALVAEVRRLVPSEKRPIWWLGPSCEPADLPERLLELGFRTPEDRADRLYAMASATPPPVAPGVEVRRIETFDDYVTATEIGWDAFGISEERRERERAHLRSMFDAGGPRSFIASVDGEPVGVGRSVYSDRGVLLIGGAVIERARGRGVYRALVRARWDDAVARGTPAMIVEAMPDSSYPILKRIGFEEVCVIRRLEDQPRVEGLRDKV